MSDNIMNILNSDLPVIDVVTQFFAEVNSMDQDLFDEIYYNMNTSLFRLPLLKKLILDNHPAASMDVCGILGAVRNVHGAPVFNLVRNWFTGESIQEPSFTSGTGPKKKYVCDSSFHKSSLKRGIFDKHLASPFKINEHKGPTTEQQIIIRPEQAHIIKDLETGLNDMMPLLGKDTQRQQVYVFSANRSAEDIHTFATKLESDPDFIHAQRKIILYPMDSYSNDVFNQLVAIGGYEPVYLTP